jgi:anaerobic selenocysteine-containing dehydrogenase
MFGEYDQPDTSVHLSPADAAARGLVTGQPVKVTNGEVTISVTVTVDDTMRDGVASIPKGLWSTATPEGLTGNAFAPDGLSDLAGGARFNDAVVDVLPA